MKYVININQEVLSKTDLDIIDASILDWIIIFCNSKNERIESQRIDGYTWIDYGTLIADMPLLHIRSTTGISKRIAQLKDSGFIETLRIHNQKVYVKLTSKVDELFIKSSVLDQKLGATVPRARSYSSQLTPKARSYGKPTNILYNNSNTNTLKDMSEVSDSFDTFWNIYPRKEQKKKSQQIWERKKLDGKVSDIVTFIEKAKSTDRWKKGYIKQPTTFLNGECWEDDLTSYEDIKNNKTIRVA